MKPKFNVNDKVHLIEEYRAIDCLTCDKSGTITIRDERLECPKCDGAGKIYNEGELKWHYEGCVELWGVHIAKGWKGDIFIRYEYNDKEGCETSFDHDRDAENLFKSKSEALSECNKRNSGK